MTTLPDNTESTDYYAVEGEPYEFSFLDQVEHPFAGQTTNDERRKESDEHRHEAHAYLFGAVLTHKFYHIEQGFAEDGDYHHEEGELGHLLAVVAKEDTRGDGGT